MLVRRSILTVAVVAALALAGCSGGDSGTEENTSADGSTSETADAEAGTDDETEADDTESPDDPEPEPADEPDPAPEPLPPVIDALDPMVLLTPESGGGDRPLLEWEPVPGASRYLVVVYSGTGEAMWSTITEETSTHVGGPLPIPSANSGPRITAGSTWVVYADDADGLPIAASGVAPIAP